MEGMSCFQAVIKREIRKFQVVQVQRQQRIVQKKSDAPAKVVVLRIPTHYFFNLLVASTVFVAYAL